MTAALEIRAARPEDAGAFLDLQLRLDAETAFMMLEPSERKVEVEAVAARLRDAAAAHNAAIVIAQAADGRLAGFASAEGGAFRRNRHSAHVVIGVLQAYRGQGLGERLLAALEDWAVAAGLRRLELTVMAHNDAAIRLYRRRGFDVEGLRRMSLIVDGAPVDEYAMSKIVGG